MDRWKPETNDDVKATAKEICKGYSPEAMSVAIANMLKQRLVHPDLVKINLDTAKTETKPETVNQLYADQ